MMQQSEILEDWKQRECVLATMHNKESVIALVLKEEIGIHVTIPTHFNTDRFGTFTRDVARADNQLEAARAKALAAMKLTGLDLALASEGSFGAHPSMLFLPSNLELVLLIDKKNDIEVVGHYRTGSVRVQSQKVWTPEETVEVALSWGFPAQGVIVRLSEERKWGIYKEVRTIDELQKISRALLSHWWTKSIFLETDMRAHRCPARMVSIKEATLDLIKNCLSLCPQCRTPGFVVTEVLRGLPCSGCGLPSELATALLFSCQKCLCTESRPVEGCTTADPGQCGRCNP